MKVARGQDKDMLKELNYDYVSDEENGVGINNGKCIVRPPVW